MVNIWITWLKRTVKSFDMNSCVPKTLQGKNKTELFQSCKCFMLTKNEFVWNRKEYKSSKQKIEDDFVVVLK